MPMLEEEVEGITIGGLAARAETTLMSWIGGTDYDQAFLNKKMEIDFWIKPGLNADGTIALYSSGLLVLFHDDGVTADAEAALDAAPHDTISHNDIVWSMPFIWQPDNVDDTSGWAMKGTEVAVRRTKSFPKGYPFNLDDTYSWRIINTDESAAWVTPASVNAEAGLRVRSWGIYL